jgi:hypothetical protein
VAIVQRLHAASWIADKDRIAQEDVDKDAGKNPPAGGRAFGSRLDFQWLAGGISR